MELATTCGSVEIDVNWGKGSSNCEYETCELDRPLLGSVMIPAKGLSTWLLRQAMLRIWQSGPFGSGPARGTFSTHEPRWSSWFKPLKGRWVPFLPMYSALITIWLGNSRSMPRLQLCS